LALKIVSDGDLFDGVSATTAQLIDIESAMQGGLWAVFALFVLPCCVFFFCVVHYRMEKLKRVCFF
jgi:hypothetical protein